MPLGPGSSALVYPSAWKRRASSAARAASPKVPAITWCVQPEAIDWGCGTGMVGSAFATSSGAPALTKGKGSVASSGKRMSSPSIRGAKSEGSPAPTWNRLNPVVPGWPQNSEAATSKGRARTAATRRTGFQGVRDGGAASVWVRSAFGATGVGLAAVSVWRTGSALAERSSQGMRPSPGAA